MTKRSPTPAPTTDTKRCAIYTVSAAPAPSWRVAS